MYFIFMYTNVAKCVHDEQRNTANMLCRKKTGNFQNEWSPCDGKRLRSQKLCRSHKTPMVKSFMWLSFLNALPVIFFVVMRMRSLLSLYQHPLFGLLSECVVRIHHRKDGNQVSGAALFYGWNSARSFTFVSLSLSLSRPLLFPLHTLCSLTPFYFISNFSLSLYFFFVMFFMPLLLFQLDNPTFRIMYKIKCG